MRSDGGPSISRRSISRRALLLSVPAVALARGLFARERVATLPVRGLHQVTLAVSDLERSLDFYQALFGMPVQARQGSAALLRVGAGPQFLALVEAGSTPPRIDHFGLAVEDFAVDQILDTLAGHGVTRGAPSDGLSGGALKVRETMRGTTTELHLGDLNGLVIQLQAETYCGGGGPLGDACASPEAAPGQGSLALVGMSHLTINVPDPEGTNAFYQQVFGFEIQAYQAASPLLGVGSGGEFLMFIAGGGFSGRGAAAATPTARINHACLTVEDFDVERVQQALEGHGITPRGTPGGAGPLRHWVSMRMPNRGGAPGGTPELYFSDPDGLSIQLQHSSYCGGGGYLGEVCG